MNSVKTTLTSLRNIEWRRLKTETNKINQIIPYISTNNITDLNDLIYAGAELVCEKIGVPSKSTKKPSKPGWEVRLETQIRNLRKQAKMVKQKDPGICGKGMEKTTREKNNSTTWRNKPEGSGERKETKEISTIQTKQDIPKQRKKILSTIGRAWHKNIPTTRRQRYDMGAYDIVPQSWIINTLKMYKISHETINFIEKTM